MSAQFSFSSLLNRHSTNFVTFRHISRFSIKMPWAHPNEIHNCYHPHAEWEFSSCENIPSLGLHCKLFIYGWLSRASGIFSRVHATFKLGKPFKSCVLSNVRPQKATCNISVVSIAFVPSMKQTLVQTPCSSEPAIFQDSKIANGTHTHN